MNQKLTADTVKREIYARIEKELRDTKATDLRALIFEKPWCTGGKCEKVVVSQLNKPKDLGLE